SPASNVRSSQKTTKRYGAASMRSAMSGRSTRSALSTSMSRRPFAAYRASIAFTSELLPVPREPVSRTLLAGSLETNWRVLRSIACFCASIATRSASAIECGCGTPCRYPRPLRLRQRAAVTRFQSGSGAAGGSSASTRASTASARRTSASSACSRAVVGIDRYVVVREVAGPHFGARRTAAEEDGEVDVAFRHHALAVGLGVRRRARAVIDNEHIAEAKRHPRRIEPVDCGITNRTDDPAEVGVGGKERRLDERRMSDRECDAP